MTIDFARQKSVEAGRWAAMHIKSARLAAFHQVAAKLIGNKPIYQRIEAHLVGLGKGVPWWVIAVIDERESGGHCNAQLGQGDPLGYVSTHVPAGRGPFFGADAFDRSCYDALIDCAPHAALWADWTAGGVMCILEQYNGEGYWLHGMPSPYLWSGTDQYARGKYVRDGVFDYTAVDEQLGCAGLIATMKAIDGSIAFAAAPGRWVTAAPASSGSSSAPAPIGVSTSADKSWWQVWK